MGNSAERFRIGKVEGAIEKPNYGFKLEELEAVENLTPAEVWSEVAVREIDRYSELRLGYDMPFAQRSPAAERPPITSEEQVAINCVQTIFATESAQSFFTDIKDPDSSEAITQLADKIAAIPDIVLAVDQIRDLLRQPIPLAMPYYPKLFHNNQRETVARFLKRRFEDYVESKRGLVALRRAVFLMGKLFPEVDPDMIEQLKMVNIEYQGNQTGIPQGAYGGYGRGRVSVDLTAVNRQTRLSLNQTELDTQLVYSLYGQRSSRYASEVHILVHELSHALHELMLRKQTGNTDLRLSRRRATVAAAVDEGFAVMMELIFIDRFTAVSTEVSSLSPYAADLQRCKSGRFTSLREHQRTFCSTDPRKQQMGNEDMDYTDGVFVVAHKIYKQKGLTGLLKFAREYDPVAMAKIPRSQESLEKLLADSAT